MNTDQVAGKFEQIKGEIKKTWGKLTDDEILTYQGNQEKFFGVVKEKYGIAREVAEKRIQELEKACCTTSSACSTDSSKVA